MHARTVHGQAVPLSRRPADRVHRRPAYIFFAASATADSRINVSPRGTDGFRVLDDRTVAYLDRTGSGNETAAHLKADGRLTVMFCSFDEQPAILRLYGRAAVLDRHGEAYARVLSEKFDGVAFPGARQIVRLDVDLVQTSCGYGVPLFDYAADRQTLDAWAGRKTEADMERYWREKNLVSMDGLPTGIFGDEPV